MKKILLGVLVVVVLIGGPAGWLLWSSDSLQGARFGREHDAAACVEQSVREVMEKCEDARCAALRSGAFVRSCLQQTSDEAGRADICGQRWDLPARAALVKGVWCATWADGADPRCQAAVDQVPEICSAIEASTGS